MSTTVVSEPIAEPVIVPPQNDDAPEPIQRKLFKPQTIASFFVAIAIVVFIVNRLDISPGAVWNNIQEANPWYFLAALALYYLTFVARTLRWRYMLSQAGIDEAHGYNMPSNAHLMQIILLSWFANCIVPAKLGDGYRSYLLKRDCGAPASATLGTILAERMTDLTVLFVTMTAAGVYTFHGDMPPRVLQTVWIGGALMAVAIGGLIALFVAKDFVQKFVPNRFVRHYENFHGAVFACLRQPAVPIAVSLGIWMADGLRLYLVGKSLGADLSISLTIFVALMAALLTTLPITPAGLGVVEAAVIVVLQLVAVDPDLASSIAILDRVIGYWSLILVGMILYMYRLRRDVIVDPKQWPVRSSS